MYFNNKDEERLKVVEETTVEPKKISEEYMRLINTKINVILLGKDKVNIIMDKRMWWYGHVQRKEN